MRLLVILLVLLAGKSAIAAPPDLLCQEVKVLHIDPRALSVREYDSSTIYRIKSGNLYISSPDRVEYMYNKVSEVEAMRYVSGHKVIQFEAGRPEYRSAIFVHTHLDEVRVSRARCQRL